MIAQLIDTRLNAALTNGKHEVHAALKELKEACLKQTAITLEPSRLEIASRIMQGWAARDEYGLRLSDAEVALKFADALIEAAKEAQP